MIPVIRVPKKWSSFYKIMESMLQRKTLKYIPLDFATSVTSPQPEYKDLSFGTFTQIVTVNAVTSRKKERRQAKKLKRGKKNFKSMEETGETSKHIQDTAHTVTRKVGKLEMGSPLTYRMEQDQKFQFTQEVKEDFKCPICKDILLKPLETFCEHYFRGECFKQALQKSGFPLDCPVCRTELNSVDHIKKPS